MDSSMLYTAEMNTMDTMENVCPAGTYLSGPLHESLLDPGEDDSNYH